MVEKILNEDKIFMCFICDAEPTNYFIKVKGSHYYICIHCRQIIYDNLLVDKEIDHHKGITQ